MTITATKDLTETLTSTATDIPPTLTPSETPTPEPTSTPTLAPGEAPALPENQADWEEYQVYQTVNEADEEIRVIIIDGEMVEVSEFPADKNGEIFPNMMTLEEFRSRVASDPEANPQTTGLSTIATTINYDEELQAFEPIDVSAIVIKMIAVDGSHFTTDTWFKGAVQDSHGVYHPVMIMNSGHSIMLQKIDEQGAVTQITARSGALHRFATALDGGIIEFDLASYDRHKNLTGDNTIVIKPGDEVAVVVEVPGKNNSSLVDSIASYTGVGFNSIEELNDFLLSSQKSKNTRMNERVALVVLDFILDDDNTE
ncbi:MAG: hypothetical protein DRI56_02685 [Chloroflexota bacterium]|nr:MAG: hypothetical protein DRI56_02685 [Chloroflexota bacterium]